MTTPIEIVLTIGSLVGLVGLIDVLFCRGQIGVTLAKFIERD